MTHLHRFLTPEALSAGAASFIIDLAQKAVRDRGRFIWALSGGRTPENLYRLLSKPPYRDKMPWQNTLIFWSDERCVPPDDPQNNALMAQKALLDKVEIPDSNIFRIPTGPAPEEAARQYERTLRKVFEAEAPRFDLIMLGVGADGHTASLFPGTQALRESTRWVCENFVETQRMYRITFTFPLLNQARCILFLVSGKDKANILKEIRRDELPADAYPARMVRPEHGETYWYADEDAAALLGSDKR